MSMYTVLSDDAYGTGYFLLIAKKVLKVNAQCMIEMNLFLCWF